MAIGSPDKAGRLDQLRTFARCQVWSGYRTDAEVRAEVYDAARAEERDPARAQALTDAVLAAARQDLLEASRVWPASTPYDRLQSAFAELRGRDVVVLEAVDDHWAAHERLAEDRAGGRPPRGIAYFTHPDVWHAVEHGMLELNVWHGTTANVAPGDELLDLLLRVLHEHGIAAVFDEGRIEATVAWQRRPPVAAASR
ncbi:MAG: DUF6891 domain-containing protein [Nocardioidaceae bacterium]